MDKYITAQQIANGKNILPIDRIKLMSPDEWEALIEEWLETTQKYDSSKIERLGGAGDMGIDVIAYITNPKDNPNYKWDCYQCKRYNKPLNPSSMWIEFGKIIYYSFICKFPAPKSYYLVGTHGIGTSLKKYFIDSNKLKSELLKQWDSKCKNNISNTTSIPLEGAFLDYFEKFDFKIFNKVEPKIVVEGHKKHANHILRFGGGLPSRQNFPIPDIEADKELRYIKQLVKAYDSDSDSEINEVNEISKYYERHFTDSRKSFYKAEELRVLTRDNLPEIFESLKDEIFDGVINTVENKHENGYTKVKTVEDKAVNIKIESNPLREACETIDKKGLCHHLVNDEKISWVEDEE